MVAAALALTLVGCGSSDGSDGSDAATPGASTSGSASTDASAATTDTTDATEDAAEPSQEISAYVDAARKQIPDLLDLFDDLYSDLKIDAEGTGTLVYTYVYSKQVDPDAAKQGIKSQEKTLQSTCDTALFPEMASAGITDDPQVRFDYQNPDGSQIATYTCTPS